MRGGAYTPSWIRHWVAVHSYLFFQLQTYISLASPITIYSLLTPLFLNYPTCYFSEFGSKRIKNLSYRKDEINIRHCKFVLILPFELLVRIRDFNEYPLTSKSAKQVDYLYTIIVYWENQSNGSASFIQIKLIFNSTERNCSLRTCTMNSAIVPLSFVYFLDAIISALWRAVRLCLNPV